MEVFNIVEPVGKKVPILISSPHSGTNFPDELKDQFIAEKRRRPDDADWFIHQLYDFAPEMGITMITANYCRWVIDLNRDPESKPLYNDGRIITSLCPHTDFFGEPIYNQQGYIPDDAEVDRRRKAYYDPYHGKIASILADLKGEFGTAILFDAHSIRKHVETINKEAFPDLILGTNDGKTASEQVIQAAKSALEGNAYSFAYNHPFKGGQITRFFGDPMNNIHAIQLEQAKTNYMDDKEVNYAPERAENIRKVLQQLFSNIIATLQK
ncbi:MAG: N-formylglutamate amidohydrolase [Crocinitomicaceae bacterium]|nr:N-formylglutamate amidohydrolase [Crocinitomicaceae bacterium]